MSSFNPLQHSNSQKKSALFRQYMSFSLLLTVESKPPQYSPELFKCLEKFDCVIRKSIGDSSSIQRKSLACLFPPFTFFIYWINIKDAVLPFGMFFKLLNDFFFVWVKMALRIFFKHFKIGLKAIPFFLMFFLLIFKILNIMHRNYSKHQQNQILYFVFNRL